MVKCILRTSSLQHKSPKTDVSVVSMRFVQLNRMQWIAAGGRISLSFTFHMLLFMYWIRLHSFDVVRLGHRHLNFSNRQHCDCKINRNTLNLRVYGYYVPLPARHTDHDHMFFFCMPLSHSVAVLRWRPTCAVVSIDTANVMYARGMDFTLGSQRFCSFTVAHTHTHRHTRQPANQP